ncbi:hypothetical protein Trydic_g6870 [Trypoxylus dichotomus]
MRRQRPPPRRVHGTHGAFDLRDKTEKEEIASIRSRFFGAYMRACPFAGYETQNGRRLILEANDLVKVALLIVRQQESFEQLPPAITSLVN